MTAWSPFRHAAFAVLWMATVVSNVGVWMYNAASGWLMTALDSDPMIVALVQVATALPMFLFALPAGALADILDRRRLLIIVQIAMALVAAVLGMLVAVGRVTPPVLLVFTFLSGAGSALVAPAWQAIVPQLVPRTDLQPAISLNGIGINISRAVGPALAGLVIAGLGMAAPFFLNAVSYLGVIVALLWWHSPQIVSRDLPAERFMSAIRIGLRHARHNAHLRSTLVRAIAFFVFASAYWALLPLIARHQVSGGPGLYGILLGAIGAGAVTAAFFLPRLKAVLGPDGLAAIGAGATALALALFALASEPLVALVASVLAGIAWIAVLSSLNVSAQVALPDWVRARGLSVFVAILFGAMTIGSVIWGQLATMLGLSEALLISAVGAALAVPLTWRWKLQTAAGLDMTPSMHWPEPVMSSEIADDRGPVMVTVEYRIDPSRTPAFVAAMNEVAAERRRDGAYGWGLFEDAGHPGRWLEYFLVESWLEHRRQHERVTKADADVQARALAFHVGETPPVVVHWLASVHGEQAR